MNSHYQRVEKIVHPLLVELGALTNPHPSRQPITRPFITISRQAGAGGTTFATKLVELLNARHVGDGLWRAWDRELVETVANQQHLSAALVEALEDRSRTWLEDFFAGLQQGGSIKEAEELQLFHRVAATVRAVACAGNSVIVGRGGSFITQDLPGGIHIRLVAPLDWRVKHAAEVFGYAPKAAADWVQQMDRARDTFYRRYGPAHALSPESFVLTLNPALADFDQLAECVTSFMEWSDSRLPRDTGLKAVYS